MQSLDADRRHLVVDYQSLFVQDFLGIGHTRVAVLHVGYKWPHVVANSTCCIRCRSKVHSDVNFGSLKADTIDACIPCSVNSEAPKLPRRLCCYLIDDVVASCSI